MAATGVHHTTGDGAPTNFATDLEPKSIVSDASKLTLNGDTPSVTEDSSPRALPKDATGICYSSEYNQIYDCSIFHCSFSYAEPFKLGAFSIDEHRPMKVIVIGAGFSGIIAGIRLTISLPTVPKL